MSFMEIFQPGLKYLREERERQRMHVAYPTDGADPLVEIDLDAGTATVVVPRAAPSEADASHPEATRDGVDANGAGPSTLNHADQPETTRTVPPEA